MSKQTAKTAGTAKALSRKILTPAQAERRRSAISAARVLAKEGGFDAVSISAVAERANVSRATLYHYFGSKAQLLAELTLDVTEDLTAAFDHAFSEGKSPADKVGFMLEHIIDWAMLKPKLFSALATGWTSDDIDDPTVQRAFDQRMLDYIETSLGSETLDDAPEIAIILGHIVFSCLVRMNTGIATREDAKRELRLAARLLIKAP